MVLTQEQKDILVEVLQYRIVNSVNLEFEEGVKLIALQDHIRFEAEVII